VDTLTRFEKLIERLIERPFERLFKTRLHPADLTKALAQAMENGRLEDGRSGSLAPNHYQISLNEKDLQRMPGGAAMEAEVAAMKRYLRNLIAEAGYTILDDIQIRLSARPEVKVGRVKVTAGHRAPVMTPAAGKTTTKPMHQSGASTASRWQLRTAERVIPLGGPTVRLGRGPNNDVVLADPTVAQYHAQLRWRNQTYYIQNLSHTKLLTVNQRPVTASTPLQPGDQLQLGQVLIQIDLIK